MIPRAHADENRVDGRQDEEARGGNARVQPSDCVVVFVLGFVTDRGRSHVYPSIGPARTSAAARTRDSVGTRLSPLGLRAFPNRGVDLQSTGERNVSVWTKIYVALPAVLFARP